MQHSKVCERGERRIWMRCECEGRKMLKGKLLPLVTRQKFSGHHFRRLSVITERDKLVLRHIFPFPLDDEMKNTRLFLSQAIIMFCGERRQN